jgi:hypothetical protein
MEIISEVIMALGMIVLAVVFSLVISQVTGGQQSDILSESQSGMAGELSTNIDKLKNFEGSTQLSFNPPVDLYDLNAEKDKLELSVDGEDTKEVSVQTIELEPNSIEDADEICLSKEQDKISIEAGNCDALDTSNICAGGGCNPNMCQPSLGEDCSNAGCSCSSQSSPASDHCAPNYDPNYDPSYINPSGDPDPVVDLSCINEEYVSVQDKGERCEYNFECSGSLECPGKHPDASPSIEKHCCPPGESWDGSQCKEDSKFKLVFVPLNKNTGAYDSAVSQQSEFFIDNYPFRNCEDQIEVVKVNDVCDVPVSSSSCTDSNQVMTVDEIEECADDAGHGDFTKAVGVFQENVCGGTLGWSYGPNAYDAVVSTAGSTVVTAHEIGHEYGLNDEYLDICRYPSAGPLIDPNSNCLEEAYEGEAGLNNAGTNWVSDSPWCAGGSEDAPGYSVFCRGNKNSDGGRDIMSYGNAPGPRGFAPPAQNHIESKDELTCN